MSSSSSLTPFMTSITVKNVSSQSREVIIKNNTEFIHYWLKANDSVTIPSEAVTETLTELARRKILKFTKK